MTLPCVMAGAAVGAPMRYLTGLTIQKPVKVVGILLAGVGAAFPGLFVGRVVVS